MIENWSLLKIQFPFVIFLAPKFVYNILSLPLFSMSLAQIQNGGGEREKGSRILFLASWSCRWLHEFRFLLVWGETWFDGCVCVCSLIKLCTREKDCYELARMHRTNDISNHVHAQRYFYLLLVYLTLFLKRRFVKYTFIQVPIVLNTVLI